MMRKWKQSILAVTVLAAISVGLAMSLAATPAAKRDIVDTAVSAGSFKTLTAAIQAAGLTDTLKGKGPFTVFAPTDEAFAKLPAGTVDNLLKPENKRKLAAILTYHVVSGRVTAAQVSKMTEANTLNGKELAIRMDMGHVMINDATVTKADIECSNGVIHVIDTVLIPN
jgi:transforming growth factor-beta-induced protein